MPDPQRKSGDERLARFIRERREALGLSRRDLADQTGLSYPYISQLETAYRLPSPRAMHLLARSLGMPASDLFQALPSDTGQADAMDVPVAAPAAPASQWIANPAFHERTARGAPPPAARALRGDPGQVGQQPGRQRAVASSEEAARSAISALEVLPPAERLDALAKVQAALLAGIVRDQAGGPSID